MIGRDAVLAMPQLLSYAGDMWRMQVTPAVAGPFLGVQVGGPRCLVPRVSAPPPDLGAAATAAAAAASVVAAAAAAAASPLLLLLLPPPPPPALPPPLSLSLTPLFAGFPRPNPTPPRLTRSTVYY
jgi:hypothetical protein